MSLIPKKDKLVSFNEMERLAELIFIPAGFIAQVKDVDNNVLWEDKKTRAIFGDRTGQKCYKINFGRDEPCPVCTVSKSLDNMGPYTKEDRSLINGNWYRVIAIPIIYKQQLAAIELIQDVTADKLKGQELNSIHTTAPLVTNIISHDIPNYLNIVNSALESLQVSDEKEQDFSRFLGIAHQNTKKAIEILRELRNISLIEEHLENFYSVNLLIILQKTIENIKTLFTDRKVNITFNNLLRDSNPWILANNLVSEIFLNILTNAVKYAPDKNETKIDIDIYDVVNKQEFIEVKITDYGKGIPPEIQEVLFDRKIRIERGWQPAKDSTGIGMTIIKSLCNAFGAEIEYTNRLTHDWTKGTVIFVRFPQLKKIE
ncbi:MAG: sensor histidine kinase [Candidatus Hodarchaeales archaeon]